MVKNCFLPPTHFCQFLLLSHLPVPKGLCRERGHPLSLKEQFSLWVLDRGSPVSISQITQNWARRFVFQKWVFSGRLLSNKTRVVMFFFVI